MALGPVTRIVGLSRPEVADRPTPIGCRVRLCGLLRKTKRSPDVDSALAIATGLALFGVADLWWAWVLRRRAWALAAECDAQMDALMSDVDKLGKISEAVSIEHAQNFAVLQRFIATWNEGDFEAAVEILQSNGFKTS